MGKLTFRGGIHPYEGKELSKDHPIEKYLPKGDLVYPLSQHIGAPSVPCVKKGDTVLAGQKIADAGGFVSVPQHASVSGTVKGIEKRLNATGAMVDAVIVDNDQQYQEVEFVPAALEDLTKEEILNRIKEGGVVGMGGAGFPTHVKLAPKDPSKIEYVLVNGAECEPLLRTDRYLMIHEAEKLVSGVDLICRELSIPEGRIALKKTYTKEIEELTAAIEKLHSKVQLHLMDSFYPAGDEQVVVYEVTGKVVPPAGIPLDVGAIVDNVATIIAVADAVSGIPFTEKYLTVTGEVREPSVLKVPVGTSFAQCIEMAGGRTSDKVMVVSGGPMMGVPMSWEAAMNASVTKTTSGSLGLLEDGAIDRRRKAQLNHMLNRAKAACVQCTFCTQLCPRHMLGHPLQPHRIMRKMAMNMPHQDNNETTKDHWILPELLEDRDIRQAAICSECGVCEVYACPMGLQPRVVNSLIKGELAQAGIRYSREGDTWEADANRPYRKVPTKRIAARAGVGAYYHIDGHIYKEETASKVVLPLKMNIGVPAEPVISDGAHVEKGQLIAACPEGKLGANLHASISGTAHLTGNAITITEV